MVMQLTWQLLLTLPFLIIGIVHGWRRGWLEEGITMIVLLVALLFFGNPSRANLLGTLINRIIEAFSVFFSTLVGRAVSSQPLVAQNSGTFQFIGFVVLAVLAYMFGSVSALRKGVGKAGRALGSLLGAANVLLIASQLFGFVQPFLPSVFQNPGTIHISTDSDASFLRSLLPTILLTLLLLLFLILVFVRLPKMRQ